ncbi:MAG: hypothetical protein QOE45_3097 [Frankiaceae bacterium]|nr:hypothetical protein [Frankiaceae bacterium]
MTTTAALYAAPDAPVAARRGTPTGARGVAVRLALAAGSTAFLGLLRIHRPPAFASVCLLRAMTGIPCPLCGGTTAFTRLGRGNVAGALAASPVALLAGAALVLAPALSGRVHVPHRVRPWLLTGVAAFAWTWQLARFDRWPF